MRFLKIFYPQFDFSIHIIEFFRTETYRFFVHEIIRHICLISVKSGLVCKIAFRGQRVMAA